MRYEFFKRHGTRYVRIAIGVDVVEREATEDDDALANSANAAEDQAEQELRDATAARVARENERERRRLADQQGERTRLDADKLAEIKSVPPATTPEREIQREVDPQLTPPVDAQADQQQLEIEFDKGLAQELDAREDKHGNGKKPKGQKSAD